MSEFWMRKMRTYFSKFDFDNDGVISRDDMANMAIRFANFEKADAQKAEHLKTLFDNVRGLGCSETGAVSNNSFSSITLC